MKNMKYVYASLMAIISIILLLGNNIVRENFTKVFATTSTTQIKAGIGFTCGLKSDGTVMCWGGNNFGQLGNGSTTNSSVPVNVSALSGVKEMVGGIYHSCALKNDATVMCWGYNTDGELGNGSTTNSSTPVNVVGLTNTITQIVSGWNHSCALKSDGTVMCWGSNNHGQLGNGSTGTISTTAVTAIGVTGVTSISAGDYHTCALKSDGTVMCWGDINFGKPGTQVWDFPTPTTVTYNSMVPDATAWMNVRGSPLHTCSIYSDQTAKCWGDNSVGELGNGTNISSTGEVSVSGLTGLIAGAIGNTHTCGLKSDGTVMCWGNNDHGQLGNGSISNSSVPVSNTVLGAVGVSLGYDHSCALKNDGTVMCWGNNINGELGNGTTNNTSTPTQVLVSAGGPALNLLNTLVSGSCTGLPSNAAYYSGASVYSLINAPSGTSLTGSYNANPSINTCQFSCNTGYSWNSSINSCSASTSSSVPTIITPTGSINTNSPTYTGNGGSGAVRVEVRTPGGILLASGATIVLGNSYSLPTIVGLSEGSNTFLVTGFDSIGIPGTTITGSVIVDTTAPADPIILSPTSGSTTGSQNFTFSGTAETGSTITMSGTGFFYTGSSDSSGNWSIPVSNFPTGTSYPVFRAKDGAGNSSSGITLTITTINTSDTTPPTAPIITSHTFGTSVSTSTIALSGTAEVGSAITIYLSGVLVSSTQTNTSGIWSTTTSLVSGQNMITVYATDAAGNKSIATGTIIYYTGTGTDTTPPAIPTITSYASGASTTLSSITLSGVAEVGSTITVYSGGTLVSSAQTNTGGIWSALVNLSPVQNTFTLYATDASGNRSGANTITLYYAGNTTVAAPVITSPVSGISTTSSVITLSGTTTAGSMVSVYYSGILVSSAQVNASGIWSTNVNLTLGQNIFAVYSTNTLGMRSSSAGIIVFYVGGNSFSGITINNPVEGSLYTYGNIVANGKGTPGNTLVVSTPTGTISSIIGADGSWSIQISLVSGSNALTFYERTSAGILSSGVSRTVTYSTNTTSTGDVTPIGSYIPSKNDPSIADHSRLDQLPSSNVCALDEHVNLNTMTVSDISGNWAEGYIRTLIRFWVIKDTDRFYPDRSITRGEFLALIVRSLRCHYSVSELDAASTTSFSDVPTYHWANKYLALSEQYGWLPASTTSRFRPDVFITRSEAMDIASAATGLSDATGAGGFSDISYLSAAIQDAILTAQKYSIIQGVQQFSNWYFYPTHPLTRAEAAKIIQRTFVR